MTRLTLAIAALALAAFAPSPEASAAGLCAPHKSLSDALSQRYQENRQGIGLAGKSQVIELYVSSEGSWTLVSTDTKGKTCIIASGEAWQNAPKILAGIES